mmetsp:Transcript_9098/g.17159  ORF Transcript_9098/g.17159 Transcript_9098/m.17159 type:complete len:80 (+) Transcript_9098:1517-1756(+)
MQSRMLKSNYLRTSAEGFLVVKAVDTVNLQFDTHLYIPQADLLHAALRIEVGTHVSSPTGGNADNFYTTCKHGIACLPV